MRTIRLFTAAFICYTSIVVAQTWEQLPDFPGTPRDDAASFMIGDHIYVGTGMEVGWGLTNDWWRFDTQTETWEQVASLPASPRQYCSGFSSVDMGYLFGGLDADGALNELWAYDPDLDQWMERAPLPAEPRYACVSMGSAVFGMIATGMFDNGAATNEAWRYIYNGDSWSTMASVPGPPRHRASGFNSTWGFTITGGADSDFIALDDSWHYQLPLETGEWQEYMLLPAPRYGHRGFGWGGTLSVSGGDIVMGGASATTTFHNDVWQKVSDEWVDLPAFPPGPRRGGVIAGKTTIEPVVKTIYFGLGLQPEGGDFIRMNDWWKLTYPLSIDERDVATITVFPNPAQDRITVHDINSKAGFIVLDVLGRSLNMGTIVNGTIDVGSLSAGRYTLLLMNEGTTLRSSFIKLP